MNFGVLVVCMTSDSNQLSWGARNIGTVGTVFCILGLIGFYWGVIDGVAALAGIGGVLVGMGVGMLKLSRVSDVLQGLATGEIEIVDAEELEELKRAEEEESE